ncbi:putative amino-acid metabolite efflux pump [Paenibacillus solanacearum]|uniref:Amino-acid metabolite efflux pump n=1 Tax=Paenibacillus solanacearum TaxID=2048548 RepID=A0A916JVE1_9BACL|nr:DMT family transporter [Paenibacillus solanacearum]CAG7607486.1 putative amino-acid metabolite efflux pump [Paenibacillus solanacearum]
MQNISRMQSFFLITFLVAVWGASWPIYKIALAYTPPLLFAGMRTLLGGLMLAALLYPRRSLIRWKQNWQVYLISSVFNVILFYGLQTVGLMYMPSGLFSVLVYLQPVLVGVFAWLWLGEPMNTSKIAGLVIGFLGVATVSAGGFSGHIAIVGIVLALMTGLSWALGTVYVKKTSGRVDSLWLVAFQCFFGGIVLTGAGSVTEGFAEIVWNIPYIVGLVFGIVIGISASWAVYFKLVQSGEASKVASYTFLVPLISVFSGTLFLKEPFTFNLVIGLILIGVSIYWVNRKPAALKQAAMPHPHSAKASG